MSKDVSSRTDGTDDVREGSQDPPRVLAVEIMAQSGGQRLDKALTAAAPDEAALSRSRLRALAEAGCVTGADGAAITDLSAKAVAGARYDIALPAPTPARPAPEAIPLSVIHEDAELIVVDKPAGMAVHPAPGSETGTLVNALLAHCGDTLSGVGGEIRPGIVHRIDKETSGLLVVAKSDRAHQGLAAQFAAHDLERSYLALCWGALDRGDPRLMGLPAVSVVGGALRIDAPIGRHPADRKKMAVVKGGRRAVTWVERVRAFGLPEKPVASLIRCRLETGRTHQIRVHLTHVGCPLAGDPVYGRARLLAEGVLSAEAAAGLRAFPRQALHAQTLGFRHPVTGDALRFETPPPSDLADLIAALAHGNDDPTPQNGRVTKA